MNRYLCAILLLPFPACATETGPEGDHDPSIHNANIGPVVESRFEEIHDVMELTDETVDPLFDGDWKGNAESLKALAANAQLLVHGFGSLQTTLKPKDVEADFVEWAKDTQGFMKKLAAAASKDTQAVNALFADPRFVGKNYCGRCHDKYRDD